MIEAIQAEDAELGELIKDALFVFDNLLDIDDRGMQAILREVQADTLATALKGADEEIREKIFKNMSKRAAEILRDDIASKGPVRLSEVEQAQKEILAVVLRLVRGRHDHALRRRRRVRLMRSRVIDKSAATDGRPLGFSGRRPHGGRSAARRGEGRRALADGRAARSARAAGEGGSAAARLRGRARREAECSAAEVARRGSRTVPGARPRRGRSGLAVDARATRSSCSSRVQLGSATSCAARSSTIHRPLPRMPTAWPCSRRTCAT